MPTIVVANTIQNDYRRAVTEQAVRAGIGTREEQGEYVVTISGFDESRYHIMIDGPEGRHVNHDFIRDDCGVVRNFVSEAIPYDVPVRNRVLCDICMEHGWYWLPMDEDTSGSFVCSHDRWFQTRAGYYGGGIPPSIPAFCREGCGVMHVEFVDGGGRCRLRCGGCHRYAYGYRNRSSSNRDHPAGTIGRPFISLSQTPL